MAKPVSFDFVGVSLVTFAQATFKSIMGRDFVIAPEVVAMDRKITLNIRTIDSENIPAFVENMLLQQGIKTVKRGEVYYLESANENNTSYTQNSSSSTSKNSQEPNIPVTPRSENQLVHAVEDKYLHLSDDSSTDQDAESRIYSPVNRPADFMMNVINAGFGKKSAHLAGGNLIITAKKTQLDKIFLIIDKLDVAPAKVDVLASWVEVTRTGGASRGVSLIASFLGTKFGATLGTTNAGSPISIQRANFQMVIDALNTDTRFNQVSHSQMVGDDYVKINLTVGDETPTVSSTGKDNSGNAVQNIVYRQAGSIVDVVPKVLASGKINLSIDGQISSFKATATGVNGSPTLTKRQVKTEVTVENGEVLLIGGLNDTQTIEGKSGFAFLPDSWAAKSSSNVHTDLVLILSVKTEK